MLFKCNQSCYRCLSLFFLRASLNSMYYTRVDSHQWARSQRTMHLFQYNPYATRVCDRVNGKPVEGKTEVGGVPLL